MNNIKNNISIYTLVVLSILFIVAVLSFSSYKEETDRRLDSQEKNIRTVKVANKSLRGDLLTQKIKADTLANRLETSEEKALSYLEDKEKIDSEKDSVYRVFDNYRAEHNASTTAELRRTKKISDRKLTKANESLKYYKDINSKVQVELVEMSSKVDKQGQKIVEANKMIDILRNQLQKDSIIDIICNQSKVSFIDLKLSEERDGRSIIKELKPKNTGGLLKKRNKQWEHTTGNVLMKLDNKDIKLSDYQFGVKIYNQDRTEAMSYLEENMRADGNEDRVVKFKINNNYSPFRFVNHQEKKYKNYIIGVVLILDGVEYPIGKSFMSLFVNGKNVQMQ